MSKRVDYTTYRRATQTREGYVGKCPKCGLFGLRFSDETIHCATFDRGVMFTDRPADRCQIVAPDFCPHGIAPRSQCQSCVAPLVGGAA